MGTDDTPGRLDEDMVQAALGDLDRAEADGALEPAFVAALRLADVLTSDHPEVTSEFQSYLREYFDDGQILELGSALAVASGWQRFIEAFGIRPDQWSPATPPVPKPGE